MVSEESLLPEVLSATCHEEYLGSTELFLDGVVHDMSCLCTQHLGGDISYTTNKPHGTNISLNDSLATICHLFRLRLLWLLLGCGLT